MPAGALSKTLIGLRRAGIACSVSTDGPAKFATDLAADYAAALKLGWPGMQDPAPSGDAGSCASSGRETT